MNITETSKNLFLEYAKDAPNWSGTPLVGGNVGGTKEERGNLTQLKKAGLIVTWKSEDGPWTWLQFTREGVKFAEANGVKMWDYDQEGNVYG